MFEFLKKYWFQILIVAILIIITVVVIQNGKKPKSAYTPGGGTTPPGSTSLDKNKLLSKGMSGPEVSELQRLINQGYSKAGLTTTITVDGSFGSGTEQALHYLTNRWSINLYDAEFLLQNYG